MGDLRILQGAGSARPAEFLRESKLCGAGRLQLAAPGFRLARVAVSALLLLAVTGSALAERQPVLSQIKVPHDYYYREMYLPQVTTGPAAPAWLPDSKTLVYAMAGHLWRQEVGSNVTVQLTEGALYDSQPDVSADGSRVVFSRYDGSAVELWLLDLDSGESRPLTSGGDVNVEPRFSPDGSRIAWVSTRGSGRFHVEIGTLTDEGLDTQRFRAERQSDIPRYYYSPYDHELSPVWTADGKALIFVANTETPYGTGGIWRQAADGGEALPLRVEETSWRARPDVLPDGKRFVYASYLGRQWHQVWIHRIDGRAEPFPLTYGDYDSTAPRVSPDGNRVAYVVNEHGNTNIRVQELVGGAVVTLDPDVRRYIEPVGRLEISTVDSSGEPVPSRISVLDANGRAYAPDAAWMHADDGFDRDSAQTETLYFHSTGRASMTLPAGPTYITVWRGPEYQVTTRELRVRADAETDVEIRPERLDLPDDWSGWQSADVHVHMNYAGTYRNTPERLVAQAEAEDLDVVFNLIVNKEQRIPDVGYFSGDADPASTRGILLRHDQEFHTSHWGHLGLLGLSSHLLIPDYAGYPETAAASLYPDNSTIAELAHAQGALVGYVHPFLAPPPDPENDAALTHALPVDAVLGLADFYEVVGFADHRASADVWYRLMNCGIRLPAAGGTDAMANYASLRGPVGQNRTYAQVGGASADLAGRQRAWLQALAAGRSIATNGPLIGFEIDGEGPGGEIDIAAGSTELRYRGFLRSNVPVDHLEVVMNGKVVATLDTGRNRQRADFDGTLEVNESGWVLLRVWNEDAHPWVFDLYPYATTTPVWISVDGRAARSPADAAYFEAWIGRLRQSAVDHPDYNSESERRAILDRLELAAARFASCR